MFDKNLKSLRKELLDIYGIGQETADSILLYAGNYPIFVIDAYTRRLFNRLGYSDRDIKYKKLQELISSNITTNLKIYQEYHALIVELGKEYCFKTEPDCSECPLA
jgi:endonuclease-3 related protein